MYFCTFIVSSFVLLIILYTLFEWVVFGFKLDFFYIDSCLDLGGRWNYELDECEGSQSYIEWKERTIW